MDYYTQKISQALHHVLPLYTVEAWDMEVKNTMEEEGITNPLEAGMVALIANLEDLERI